MTSVFPLKTCGFDLRSLSVFRILFGLTLIYSLALRVADNGIEAHYSEAGVVPLAAVLQNHPYRWSILDAFHTVPAVSFAFIAFFVVFAAYTVGFKTKLCQLLVLLILTSLYHRNPFIDDGSDWVIRWVAAWTLFLPLGEFFSIDRLRKNPNARLPIYTGHDFRSIAALGFAANLALCYFLNAFQKNSAGWQAGTATYDILWEQLLATPIAVYARGHFPFWIFPFLTYGILLMEYALSAAIALAPFSVWARRYATAGMILLHLSIVSILFVSTYSLAFVSMATLFISAADWARLFKPGDNTAERPLVRVGVTKPWRTIYNATAVFFMLTQLSVIITNTYLAPSHFKLFIRKHTPPIITAVTGHLMITQEWFMFREYNHEIFNLCVVGKDSRTGETADAIRGRSPVEFGSLLYESNLMNKFWLSYLFRMAQIKPTDLPRSFLGYFLDKGFKEAAFYKITAPIPAKGEAGAKAKITEIASMSKQVTIDFDESSVRSRHPDVSYGLQEMAPWGDNWLGGNQLFFVFGGSRRSIDLIFNHPFGGIRTADIRFTVAPDYGTFAIYVNGLLAKNVDLFDAYTVSSRQETLPNIHLRKGRNILKIVCTGKNANSQGYRFGIDYLDT